jgi:hypothetical protein
MRIVKYLLTAAVLSLLAGCGGHGFEGEYEMRAGNEGGVLNDVLRTMGNQRLVIGENFIESQGQRMEFEEIFVRSSGNERHLVLKDGRSEQLWDIEDQDTLLQRVAGMELRYVRVD